MKKDIIEQLKTNIAAFNEAADLAVEAAYLDLSAALGLAGYDESQLVVHCQPMRDGAVRVLARPRGYWPTPANPFTLDSGWMDAGVLNAAGELRIHEIPDGEGYAHLRYEKIGGNIDLLAVYLTQPTWWDPYAERQERNAERDAVIDERLNDMTPFERQLVRGVENTAVLLNRLLQQQAGLIQDVISRQQLAQAASQQSPLIVPNKRPRGRSGRNSIR